MMRVENIHVSGTTFQGAGNSMQMDSVSKNLQKQMDSINKQLQELSSNQDMTAEEKMERRQELQQELATLNQELRQHQMEEKQKQQMGGASQESSYGKPGQRQSDSDGVVVSLSKSGMQAMMAADSSVKQAQVSGSVAKKLENRANVLKAEIKQQVGGNTEKKEAEAAQLEQRAANAAASQAHTLASARRIANEAKEPVVESNTEKEETDGDKREDTERVSSAHSDDR